MNNESILKSLEYLATHNKNYNQRQYFLICALHDEFIKKCAKAKERKLKRGGVL